MTYAYPLDAAHPGTLAEVTALVGGKAANLAVMARELGLPVPPAFIITTEACRDVPRERLAGRPRRRAADPHGPDGAAGRPALRRPADPLLVSVRSGAPVSMPGMMDTILNLGLNDVTTAGLAAGSGDPAFAANCRRRFEAMFRDIVGVDAVPADPWAQLRGPIEAVFRSWNSDRARAYRAREGIPDDLGTAVTVQAMVFGNRGVDSGTGVLFTRNPATGEPVLYGDVMFNAQGEDVVAGTHATGADRRARRAAARGRRRAPRATPRRLERHYRGPVRHRVHDRARAALDAPVPDRQAEPAGGAADRRRHGRGPGLPADPRRRGPAGGRCSRIRRGATAGAATRLAVLTRPARLAGRGLR